MKIKVGCYGSVFLRLGFIFERSEEIELEVFISPKDFARYSGELNPNLRWLHVVKSRFIYLIPGMFYSLNRKRFDIYLLSQNGILVAFPHDAAKTIFYPNGYDLTVAPFPNRYFKKHMLLRPLNLFQRLLRTFILRQNLKRVSEIWCTPYPIFVKALNKLDRKVSIQKYFPNYINMFYPYLDKIEIRKKLGLQINDFVVLNPNRFLIERTSKKFETGHIKGNDVAIKAFAHFLKNIGGNSRLILIDRGEEDLKLAHRLIDSLGIGDKIIWINVKPPNKLLSRSEMAELYSISDVVFGEFGAGWFGLTTVEATFFSKPVICYVDKVLMSKFFDYIPFISSKNYIQISEILKKFYESEDYRLSVGSDSRRWFDLYFSEKSIELFWKNILLSFR